MARLQRTTHRFVGQVPTPLEDGIVYVSIEFGTVIHKCCCGCGDKVVTPLSPMDWAVVFDGQTVSLYPSIGRWNADCQSHYWIRNNRVIWLDKWSKGRIEHLKRREAELRDDFFGLDNRRSHRDSGTHTPEAGREEGGWVG